MGKKWRCSRDVVLDQKYCERHMHRGRQRSRKHVEASEITSESGMPTTPNYNNTTTTINSSDSTNTEIKVPVNLQLATPSSNSSGNTPATTSIGGIHVSENNVDAKKDSIAAATTTGLTNAAVDNGSNSRGNNDPVRGGINDGNNVNAGILVAPGFSFSPKTVLQGCACYSSSCLNYRNVVETELQRCRRTDGKKWWCSGDVVPDQKYCGWHLHRGVQKPAVAPQSITVAAAAAPPSSICLAPSLAIPRTADGHLNLDTNLSISIAASPQQMTNDENSATSSDATTITDENGSVSQLLPLSP